MKIKDKTTKTTKSINKCKSSYLSILGSDIRTVTRWEFMDCRICFLILCFSRTAADDADSILHLLGRSFPLSLKNLSTLSSFLWLCEKWQMNLSEKVGKIEEGLQWDAEKVKK